MDFPQVTLKPKRAQRAANETDPIFLQKPVPGELRRCQRRCQEDHEVENIYF